MPKKGIPRDQIYISTSRLQLQLQLQLLFGFFFSLSHGVYHGRAGHIPGLAGWRKREERSLNEVRWPVQPAGCLVRINGAAAGRLRWMYDQQGRAERVLSTSEAERGAGANINNIADGVGSSTGMAEVVQPNLMSRPS